MSSSNQKPSRVPKKRSASQQSAPGTSRNDSEISDVFLLLVVKPILEKLLTYIRDVEQNQREDNETITPEKRKYMDLRDIYLQIVHEDMAKYLELYRQRVEKGGDIVVTKKIHGNVIAMLMQTLMFLGRDIE